jgi:peptidoglycan/LPS O-acetylase OafA/YrhL
MSFNRAVRETLMRHSANLDILRSFAVVTVLIDHLVPTLEVHAGFHNAAIIAFTTNIGHTGVIAFFVHTSLVLMYSLERMASKVDRLTLHFYIRRFFRIYPLSIFCITLALVLHIPGATWKPADVNTPRIIIANLFLVQNIFTKISVVGPLWSLPYEVQMYLVLHALYYLALMKRGALYLCGLFAIFACLGFVIFARTGHLNMAAYVPCFLSGVLCFALRDRIRATVPSWLWAPFLLLMITGFCLTNLHGDPNFWIGWIFCLVLGLSIDAFHDSTNKPLNAAAEKVALYSYGMYLLHVPALYLVFMVLGIKSLAFGPVLFLALTIVASIITYHFIEAPLIDVGRKISSRRWAAGNRVHQL